MNHATFSRRGGKARSEAKTSANRAKAQAYWDSVRAGEKPAPRRFRLPLTAKRIAQLLDAYCGQSGIVKLELFGSVARGDAQPGSDIDLMATFAHNPGLRFFTMEEEMAKILRTRVHLLTRESVETMTNPFRQESILADATVIYHA